MTSQVLKRALNYGLSSKAGENIFNMATVEVECAEALCRLSEAVQTNEDPTLQKSTRKADSNLWIKTSILFPVDLIAQLAEHSSGVVT